MGGDEMTELEDIILKQDAEIERLQEEMRRSLRIIAEYEDNVTISHQQLTAKDAEINDLMANCNQLRDRCWKAEGELVRWQKIAIDLKAVSYFVNFKSREQVFDLQPKEIQDKYRDRAAEELNLQVTQEAEYVERLERLALSMCLEAGWGQEEFEAALTKIREGK
jgi:Mg2+ and Co2+ transporter CorA